LYIESFLDHFVQNINLVVFPLWNLILSRIRVTGTDDDLPNRGIIRASKGLACSGIMAIASGPMSSDKDLRDMEFQVHCIEIEAYSAVLRAFIAQSNDLSWGKEELISELRKELRVSDVEHREILGKVHSDDSIKFLRYLLNDLY
ncbi:hypothetical protein GW17_00032225, partial [Ensete ventricosum]